RLFLCTLSVYTSYFTIVSIISQNDSKHDGNPLEPLKDCYSVAEVPIYTTFNENIPSTAFFILNQTHPNALSTCSISPFISPTAAITPLSAPTSSRINVLFTKVTSPSTVPSIFNLPFLTSKSPSTVTPSGTITVSPS